MPADRRRGMAQAPKIQRPPRPATAPAPPPPSSGGRSGCCARTLRDMADLIDRGPTFPLPPSVISALVRERADDIDPTTEETSNA
jgi:hypothetical protein